LSPVPTGAAAPSSPYRGLTPYTEDDAPFFFGRSGETEIIASNLLAARLTLLYGASGVGKSSVLRAGAVARLREQARENLEDEDQPAFAVVVVASWRNDPLATIRAELRQAVATLREGEKLEEPPPDATLAEVLGHWSEVIGGKLLLVFDQFEEYFLYHDSERGPGTFDTEFPQAVNRSDVRANFLLALRDDSLALLDRFKGRIPSLFDNRLRIDHLSPEQAREAVTRPIEEYNDLVPPDRRVTIEDALVDEVLEQVQTGRLALGRGGVGTVDGTAPTGIETPFLQIVLTELWDAEQKRGSRALRLQTLHELGGAEKIARDQLEARMAALPADDQDVAASIFQFLVTRSGTKIAHDAETLAGYAELPVGKVEPVLEQLAAGDARILRPIAPKQDGGATCYEIFHDVLGPAVLEWRTQRVEERRRRQAEARARRERRKARIAGAIAVLALAVAAGVAVLGWYAHDQQRSAKAQRLVAQASSALDSDPLRSVVLAEKALETRSSPEAESALRVALSESRLRTADARGTSVLSSSFSHDGHWVLSLSRSAATVIDARTGKRIAAPLFNGAGIAAGSFSPTSNLVVLAGGAGNAIVWDPSGRRARIDVCASMSRLVSAQLGPGDNDVLLLDRAGRVAVRPVKPSCAGTPTPAPPSSAQVQNPSRVGIAELSPDGRLVAVGRQDSEVELRSASTGAVLRVLSPAPTAAVEAPPPVTLLRFSSEGGLLAAGWLDGQVRAWSLATGSRVGPSLQEPAGVAAAEFSPNGRLLAIAAGTTVEIRSMPSGRLVSTLRGHTDVVNSVQWRRDSKLVVTASDDGTARIWEAASGVPLLQLDGSRGAVSTAAFSPDGGSVATASDDGYARVWDAQVWRELHVPLAAVRDAAFSPRGSEVAVGGADGELLLWRLATGQVRSVPIALVPGGNPGVNALAFSPKGDLFVAADGNGVASIRRAGTGDLVATIDEATRSNLHGEGQATLLDASFSPDGERVVTASRDGTAAVWNAQTGKLVGTLVRKTDPNGPYTHDFSVSAAAYSPDGRFIVTGGQDRLARVWDANTLRLLNTTLHGHRGVIRSIAFDPANHDLVVTASNDQTARVWSVRTRKQLAVLDAHAEPLTDAAFSPDGRFVATAGANGVVRIWDWQRDELDAVLEVHANLVNSIEFSPDPDGKWLLSSSDDHTVKLFRCETCGPLDALRDRARALERRLPPGLTR
jgi:WD40 repeat protein